ncbi:hypothetical protein LINPERPRIM_LOCUS2789 [Linum perenne]
MLLSDPNKSNNQHDLLVLSWKVSISRSWKVSISHVFHATNCVADYLANLGHSLSVGTHFFLSPDRGLSHWLLYDLIEVCLQYLVSNNT